MLPIILASGLLKIDYKKFLIVCALIDIPKDLIITLIGYYFGSYYKTIDKDLNNFFLMTTTIVILVVIVYFGLRLPKKFTKNYDKN